MGVQIQMAQILLSNMFFWCDFGYRSFLRSFICRSLHLSRRARVMFTLVNSTVCYIAIPANEDCRIHVFPGFPLLLNISHAPQNLLRGRSTFDGSKQRGSSCLLHSILMHSGCIMQAALVCCTQRNNRTSHNAKHNRAFKKNIKSYLQI